MLFGDAVEVGLGQRSEVESAGQVLAQQAVGVLVAEASAAASAWWSPRGSATSIRYRVLRSTRVAMGLIPLPKTRSPSRWPGAAILGLGRVLGDVQRVQPATAAIGWPHPLGPAPNEAVGILGSDPVPAAGQGPQRGVEDGGCGAAVATDEVCRAQQLPLSGADGVEVRLVR